MKLSPILGHKYQCFNETQKFMLMERFHANKYLTNRERSELAMLLHTEEKRIAKWYANKRQKKVDVVEGMLSQSE